MIDGKILKWKGALVGVDFAEVARQAEASYDRLRQRAGSIWAPT